MTVLASLSSLDVELAQLSQKRVSDRKMDAGVDADVPDLKRLLIVDGFASFSSFGVRRAIVAAKESASGEQIEEETEAHRMSREMVYLRFPPRPTTPPL
jgi:hypothetical protein